MKKYIVALVATSLFIPLLVGAKTTYRAPVLTPHAICRDGTLSYSVARQGTCSWHKGVKVWLR